MDAAAEQLVLDYLDRLEDAARRWLAPAEQMAFMARSRAAVARQIGETRATEADEVRRLLRRFGDPDRLAARERDRLGRPDPGHDGVAPADQDGVAAAAGQDDTDPADQDGAGPPPGQDSAAAWSGQDGADPGTGGIEWPAAPAPAARRPGARPDVAAAPGRRPAAAPALHRPMTARWRPGRDQPARPGPAAAADHAAESAPSLHLMSRWSRVPPRPAPAGPPGSPGVPEAGLDGDPDPAGGGEPAAGAASWLGEVLAVARKHPLECVAIALIGLGGLIDPWPLWPIGVLAMLVSPLWGARDKLAAVAIPLAVMLAGAIAAAGFSAHPPGMSGYAHEVRVEGWNLLRAGAVVGAAYLARRLVRGRRPRREPPWRREPPGGS